MPRAHGYTPNTWSGDWSALRALLPFFLAFPGRVSAAAGFLILAKIANVCIPIALGGIVDRLNTPVEQLLAVPVFAIVFYGFLRFTNIVAGEIRDGIFGRVTERAMHTIGLRVFEHLHALDVNYHLSRRTGALARDIERGTNGIDFLMRFMIFNIVPTLLEIGLVMAILLVRFSYWYALIVLASIVAYIGYSVVVTDRRTRFIRDMNEADNQSNAHTIDSLLNFETVKLFGNERYEARLYDKFLTTWETARRRNRLTLAALNIGQALVISLALTAMLLLAGRHVVSGAISIGDFTMINLYMMQLFIPLNFLGFVYREIKRALADIEHMFSLLQLEPAITDAPAATPLAITRGAIRFDHVSFGYQTERAILQDVSFEIPAGQKIAVVGPSGAGKSTLARLLFRLYDVDSGAICIDGQNIREVTVDSLRRAIGVVPQDTVLFNNTIRHNIGYGCTDAGDAEIARAVRLAHLEEFVAQLPEGLDTIVGERGLKVSGGEKQRIAIARMLLKRPRILIFDEATSSLDSHAEREILRALREVASDFTTLVIAHRLATIVDADHIVVLRHGRIIEHGTHDSLLTDGGVYARLWQLQQRQNEPAQPEPMISW